MPLETLRKLNELAQQGATIIFQDWPKDVPGFHEFEQRREVLRSEVDALSVEQPSGIAKIGNINNVRMTLLPKNSYLAIRKAKNTPRTTAAAVTIIAT